MPMAIQNRRGSAARPLAGRRPTGAPRRLDREDQHDRSQTGHGGQQKNRAFILEDEPEKKGRKQRSDDRAGVVHCALQAERPSAALRRHHVREQGIAGRSADSLSDPVGETDREDLTPARGNTHERPRERCDRIAGDDDGLAPAQPV
jgi:hypothetical protein